ncbi:hypothetical protein ABKV19_007565 [Rosa sericea]
MGFPDVRIDVFILVVAWTCEKDALLSDYEISQNFSFRILSSYLIYLCSVAETLTDSFFVLSFDNDKLCQCYISLHLLCD